MIETHYSKYLHEATLENAVSELAEALDSGIDAMKDFSEERAEHPRVAGKWTPKELLGHLIDSAMNNHQRTLTMACSRLMVTRRTIGLP
jgi:hypothetical protein